LSIELLERSDKLFLRLFVLRVSAAKLAEFLQFDLALDKLPILARPIRDALALFARDFYELILGHIALRYGRAL